MRSTRIGVVILSCATALAALPLRAQKDAAQKDLETLAGPRATALEITPLYVSPDASSQRITKVQIGREMVVSGRSGQWLEVYANTDVEEADENDPDTPMVGSGSTPAPVSGWVAAKGIVEETTPNGDRIVMGAAANEEALAADPRGPANAAQAARLLYRRVAEMFPHSPLAPEAAWRAADIEWQLDKENNATLPSDHARQPYLRPQINERALKKVMKMYPHTRWAALAAFDLIDNRLCGAWQGLAECPEKEAELYLKYADEFPNSPRTPRALYEAVYRLAVLTGIYQADGKYRDADNAHEGASSAAAELRTKFPDSDYSWRASALVYKLDQNIPVYGIDVQ